MYISIRPPIQSSDKVNILIFPPAGTLSASIMRWFVPFKSDKLIFHGFDYPGRGVSLQEPKVNSFSELCLKIYLSMQPLLDSPVVLFGHSFGAYVALEIGRFLHLRQNIHPKALILSGIRNLDSFSQSHFDSMLGLDENSLLNKIGLSIPDEYIEMKSSITTWIRSDLRLLAGYKVMPFIYKSDLFILNGVKDYSMADYNVSASWENRTTKKFQLFSVNAGHIFDESYMHILHQHIFSCF